MGVFEDVVLKAKSAADMAGKKTGEIVEISKMRLTAAEIQNKINEAYQALGRLVFEASKQGTDCTEQVQTKAEAIDSLYEQLDKANEKIAELRRRKKCPACQYDNPEEANFCLKCGAKI